MFLKKLRMKTPKKPALTPAPKKRLYPKIGVSVVPVALKHAYHSNTFCTPNKLKRNTVADKLNHSEMGLTPKQKEKAQTGMLAPLIPGFSSMLPNLTSKNRESSIVMDGSIDSRASIMSMNVSSSTMFGNDGPSTSKTTSYSPVVRKCMAEIGNIMDNKMSKFLETLSENFRPQTIIVEKTPSSTPWTTDPGSVRALPTVFRQELRSIVKEVLKENVGQSNGNETESILESSLLRNDPKCQLFSTSSPVFKVPSVPDGGSDSTEKSIEAHEQSEDSEVFEGRRQSNAAMRRSRRISHRLQHSSVSSLGACGTINETLRRSRRISTMREKIEEQTISEISETFKLAGKIHHKNKSLKQLHIERRESIRHAAHLNGLESDDGNEGVKNNSKKAKSTQKRCIADLNNSVIESYFANEPKSSTSNVKSRKPHIKKHRKAVLDLLNSGSMKELQILPQIGQKTAFQLVTQRTISGKFKNIAQLEKLPIWRGNSWTRFAQANLLLD
ncbi:uncharacterized protein LOC118756625 [Rhagoletis pomonella]|uniref:uncharacterized protein LOC118756625 n=1 Tax=Rhagoletis pomonella TaxID=28610 RepID=UPI00177EB84B|nr:uncharacterized protein LOC118756625 [Rhagoletis pomonella]